MEAAMKIPGPDHPITVAPAAGRVTVTFAGKVIADSRNALTLKEANYAPVQYIPREDVKMEFLTPSEHESYCPYKGEASYYSLECAERSEENAVWCYREPYKAVEAVAGHLAFYPNKVDKIEVQ
jgi:uncharacterized protein (DUF427 family)